VLSGLEAGQVISLAPPLASSEADPEASEPNAVSEPNRGGESPS